MEDKASEQQMHVAHEVEHTTYDRRSLTYASTFDSPMTALTIKTIEWLTGKFSILRMIRKFERQGARKVRLFGVRHWMSWAFRC